VGVGLDVLRPLRARWSCDIRDGGWWLGGYGSSERVEVPDSFSGCCGQQPGELLQLRRSLGIQPGSGGLLLRSQYACLLGPLIALGNGRDQLSLGGLLMEHDVAFSLPPLTLLPTFSRLRGHLIPDRHRSSPPTMTPSRSAGLVAPLLR
jgi:hypothetical protein